MGDMFRPDHEYNGTLIEAGGQTWNGRNVIIEILKVKPRQSRNTKSEFRCMGFYDYKK